jgi:D-beta-D-heptose 7-phosphate kinase/D-beta-D-heptose 1-phosphate adenosyltransferase
MGEVLSRESLSLRIRSLQKDGKKVVFTNGCFDLLHVGHVRYLKAARELGDCLVVAINSDNSMRALKGGERPIIPEEQRAEILAALSCVDYAIIFQELDPSRLISLLQPDVLVKGGDWAPEQIVGREEVEAGGGKVLSLPLVEGVGTSAIISSILNKYAKSSRNSSKDPIKS